MRYHDITKDDMNNGDGLRVVLWVSGCSHMCSGCQNPQTWEPDSGIYFDDEAKKELFDLLSRDYISGLTLSGGDPLYPGNISDVEHLLKTFKEQFPNKTVWLYTGDLWEDIRHMPLMKYVDVVVDGPFDKNLKDVTLCWKGSSNQRVIDVKESLESGEVKIYCPDHYTVLDPDSVHGSSRSGVPCMY